MDRFAAAPAHGVRFVCECRRDDYERRMGFRRPVRVQLPEDSVFRAETAQALKKEICHHLVARDQA